MIGIKVKQYLDENGIKYSFLSEKIGIPMNVLSPLLNGKLGRIERRGIFFNL